MFKVSPASLQTPIDTPNCVHEDRFRYSTTHIPDVFCDGHLNSSIVWGLFEYTESGAQRLFDHPVYVQN